MPPTSKYAKGVAKQEEVLRVALEVIAEHGYHAATVRQLADAVGLSKTGLLHHFGSKEELFAEILRRRDALGAEIIDPEHPGQIVETIVDAIRQNVEAPGLMQLYVRFSAEATPAEHAAHEHFRDRYRRLDEFGAAVVHTLRDESRVPAAADPEILAVLMCALIDGLQLRSLYAPEIDIARYIDHFFAVLDARPTTGSTP